MQIRISPDKMRDIAGEQQTLMNDVEKSSTVLDEVENRLREAWVGVAGEQMLSIVQTCQRGTQELSEELGESAQELTQIAQAFEAVDTLSTAPLGFLNRKPGFIPIKPMILDFIFAQAGEIRILPEEVRQVAVLCRRESDKLSETKQMFRVTINKLRDIWEGNACNKYMDTIEDVLKAFDEVTESLEEMAEKMVMASNRYEEVDNIF